MSKIGIWYIDNYFRMNVYDSIVNDRSDEIMSLSVNKISLNDGTTITFIPAENEPRGSKFTIGFIQDKDNTDYRHTVFCDIAADGEVYMIKNYKDYKKIIENLNR